MTETAGHNLMTEPLYLPNGKPARHFCSCGRGFYNRAGMINHGRKCEVEVARSTAFIAEIQAGKTYAEMCYAAKTQMPHWVTCQ